MAYYTQDQMRKLQEMNPETFKQNYNKLTSDEQKTFKQNYENSLNQQNNSLKIPGVTDNPINPTTSQNIIPPKDEIVWNNVTITNQPQIKGVDYVKYKDEPNWALDLNYNNFQNIYRKQARWEKLWIAEQNFLTDLKLKNQLEWKTMQEIFWIETKADKERKYQNLAMENRNLSAWDLRNNLASQWLNYDEIEKVVGYHQPYNEYLTTQKELKAKNDELYRKQEDYLNKQLQNSISQISENWRQRMNVLNTWLSFSWFWRSSHALERRDEVQQSVNKEISIAQAKVQTELALYKAQLDWADSETLKALNQNLATYTNALKNQQTENAKLAQALNDETNAKFSDALNNMIALSWISKSEVDVERSKLLWYASDKYGKPLLTDDYWHAVMIRSAIENENEMAYKREKDDRDFSYGMYKDNRDYEMKDREFTYWVDKDNKQFWLDYSKLQHQINNDNQRLKIDYDKLWLEREKLDYSMKKDALDYELKKAEKEWQVSENFIKWNQALFDDIRKDTQTFSELNRQYSNMNNVWNRFIAWDRSDRSSVEQVLVTTFNKLLDPGSVVREWEFDRSAQWQAIMSTVEWYIARVKQWWAWLTDKTLEDMVKLAQSLYNTWKENMILKKENFKSNARYLWAQPEFVDNYFNRELWIKDDKDDKDVDGIWNKKPWKKWVIWVQNWTFNEADLTAQTKEVPQKAITLALNNTRTKWQCWAFVNDYTQKLTGKRIMWDSYESKEKHINSEVPQLWWLAVWNPGWWIKEFWHTWIVIGKWKDYVIIRDANWKWDEKIMTRKVKIADILASRGGWKWWFVNFS